LSGAERFDFPEIGKLTCFNVDHEETTTLPRFFAGVRNADFKFTLGEDAIATLRVLHQLGLSRKKPIQVDGLAIVPRNLVVALLPKPVDLAGKLHGRSCVGTLGRGYQNDELKAFYVYSIADHEEAFAEMGVQATAYQTGIPPVVAAELIADGEWRGAGVMSPEQFDPDPFLDRLPAAGMPWQVRQMPVERPAKGRLRVLAA
jgi:saccharopine dehydrogenase-like NADP-dependent oxidoreductase